MDNNSQQFKEIVQTLKNSNNVIIPIHLSPDGDSVGSAITLYLLGKNLGKEWNVLSTDNIPEYIKEMLDTSMVAEKIDYENMDFSHFDLALIPDISEERLVSRVESFRLPENLKKIVIDHHIGNTKWGDINLIHQNISSTCAMLYELLRDEGLLTSEMLPYISYGILTDTGLFKNAGTSARDFTYLGEIFEKGFNISTQIGEMKKENVEQKIFKKIIYKNLELNTEKRYVFSYCTLGDLKEYKLQDSAKKFGNGIAELTNIKDYNFAFFISEKEERSNKKYTVSFRSINFDFDVSQIASQLDKGGGHKTAAGGLITDCENMEEATAKILWIISSTQTSD